MRFLNGDLQGYRFGLDLLNNVISVKQIIDPFVDSLSKAKAVTLQQLCSNQSALFKTLSDDEFLRRVEKMRNVLEHIQEIRVWFSRTTGLTLDTILPFVNCLNTTGTYQSRLSLHSAGDELSLYFTENSIDNSSILQKRELPRANLQDLVCGMTIFINQDTIKEQKKLDDISRFVSVYKKAQDIHSLRLQLEAAGHPDYQGTETQLNEAGEMSVDVFEELYEELKTALVDWKKSLKRAYNQHPRLLFLDCKQLPRLMNRLSDLVFDEVEPEVMYNALYPYMSACFPDYASTANNVVVLGFELVYSSFKGAFDAHKDDIEKSIGKPFFYDYVLNQL